MSKPADIEEIIKNNPKIDRKKLKQASKLFDDLQKLGMTRRGYRLHIRSLRPADADSEDDPRTVYLRGR